MSVRSFVLIVLAALVLTPAAVATHAHPGGPEGWTLTDTTVLVGTDSHFVMTRDPHAAPGGLDVLITNGGTVTWVTDEQALAAFEYGPGHAFTARLQVLQGTRLTVQLLTVTPGGNLVPCSAIVLSEDLGLVMQPLEIDEVENLRAVTVNVVIDSDDFIACDIAPGDRLALRVGALGGDAQIGTEDVTKGILGETVARSAFTLENPPPAFPTPELPTSLLALVGLAGVALVVRRRSA